MIGVVGMINWYKEHHTYAVSRNRYTSVIGSKHEIRQNKAWLLIIRLRDILCLPFSCGIPEGATKVYICI